MTGLTDDEEEATEATCRPVRAAGDCDDAVVLSEDGKRGHGEQRREEATDTIALS